MKSSIQKLMGSSYNAMPRRGFMQTLGAAAATFWADEQLEAYQGQVNTNSKPSDLKITDMRVAVVGPAPMRCPIIRIDTNQGVYGLGEVRDGASKNYALMLKRVILGENPCNVDKVFRKIKQFGGHARQGGGVCGVEMALWDIAGKVYNVPAYQMLGGKFRDRIRCYADTDMSKDPKEFATRLKKRVDEKGFTFVKMDLGVGLVEHIPGVLTHPLGTTSRQFGMTQHMFTGMELTPKGVDAMAAYVAQVREVIGMEVPLAADHFGHIGVNSCIKLGKALEKYNMAWLEDMIPWQYPELLRQIADAIDVPLLTGEDIYLKEPFENLCKMHAVDIIHPDLATSGGLLETKKIGDMAQGYGIPMAMHFAGTPVSFMANVHCAAATENFLVLEHHSVDVPWWEDLVQGEKPLFDKGFANLPSRPGLGVTLNDEVVKQHLAEPGYFEPTPQWDKERVNDRLWSETCDTRGRSCGRPRMIITDSLAARLESAEALDAAACADACCRFEDDTAQTMASGGGVLTFCGSASPLTHALGVGMHGPVKSGELDEIEDFFRSRGSAIAIDVCPHADPTLIELLVARGYRISEMNNVLVRALRPDESFPIPNGIDVRPATDAGEYASLVMRAFFDREHVTDEELRLGRTLFHMECATPLLAFVDSTPAGGCGVSIRNRVASLYGDGVLSAFRRRGVHTAVIADRLRRAVEAGCDIATAGTIPGSASQRNYGRMGFEVAYTKLTMVLA